MSSPQEPSLTTTLLVCRLCLLLQCFVAAQPRMSEDVPAAAPVAVSVMAA